MTGNILVAAERREASGPHTRFVFDLDDEAGRRSRSGVPRHAEVRPAASDRGRAGAAAAGAWVPTPGRGRGTRAISENGCAGARRRSRPSCSTSGIWPASATSTPTRSSGGRDCRRSGAPGRCPPEEVAALAEEIPRRLGEGVRLLGLLALRLRRHRGKAGQLPGLAAGLRQAGADVLAVWGRPGAGGRGGAGYGLLPGLPDVGLRSVGALAGADGEAVTEGNKESEPRVHSLFTFQRLSLRSRFAVLRGHLPPRFLCGPLCKLLRRCV